MSHHFAATTRSIVNWLTHVAQRIIDGAPESNADDPSPSPTARIDHPTYLRRGIAIDGMASPITDDWATPRWQVRLPH